MIIIVMGVSGCGKSTLGRALASAVPGAAFIDADDLHPPENVQLMRAGVALNDAQRWPWLQRVRDEARAHEQAANAGAGEDKMVVVACSTLKASYRAILRGAPVPDKGQPQPQTSTDIRFVYMHGDRATLLDRLYARERQGDHFMRAAMLDGQLATLEEPAELTEGSVVRVRVEDSTEMQLREVLDALGLAVSGRAQ